MTGTAPRVLLVEDEPHIRRFVRTALESEGLAVDEAETAKHGLTGASTRRPDLIIVDLGLPDRDGLELIGELRRWSTLPIIVLSARRDEADKVRALDLGADDYLTKPFGVAELLARVRAALRRSAMSAEPAGPDGLMTFGDLEIDPVRHAVSLRGQPVHLTAIEYRLLSVLARGAGKVLTHRQIVREVWGPGHLDRTHYVRIYMGHLRRKIERDPACPRYIKTETGVGYRFGD
ncbi:MAG: response regulator [Gammaproteobacteria bacterium]